MTTPHPPTTSTPQPLLLALSGPTSSGKTTLATALRRIFSPPYYPAGMLLIHQDDFYKTDELIPVRENGVKDWDCVGSVEWGELGKCVGGLKGIGIYGGGEGEGERGERAREEEEMGRMRQGNFEGEVDMDGVHGVKGISSGIIRALRSSVSNWSPNLKTRQIVLVEGFLLVGQNVPASIRSLFDVRILLRAGYKDAKERRERRNGYVTLEGFWQDPEGYFDEVVWPGYVGEHAWLFEGGDVEGKVQEEVVGREGVRVGEGGWGLEGSLGWVVGVIREGLEGGEGGG